MLPAACIVAFSSIDETVSARGRLDFADLTPVSTRVSARIERVHCHEGQWVERGALLFELDREELQVRRAELVERARGLREQREQLTQQRAIAAQREQPLERKRAERELAAARGSEALKRALAEPRRQLAAARLVSDEEARVSAYDVETARALSEARAAALAALGAHHKRDLTEIDRALAELDAAIATSDAALPLADRWLADTSIRAPVAGVVLTADPERLRGRRVDPGETIIELGDPANLRFVMRVDERDISKVARGQEVLVTLDAFPFYVYRTFRGTVSELSRAPVLRSDGGSEFRVLVALERPNVELDVDSARRSVAPRPGLSGSGVTVVNRRLGLLRLLFRSLERDHLPKSSTVY